MHDSANGTGRGGGGRRDLIDSAIDVAARAMTAGEPSAHLRQQVRTRIRTRGGRTVPVWLPAAAVVGALVIGAVIMQQAAPTVWPSPPPVEGRAAASLIPVDVAGVLRAEGEQRTRPERTRSRERTIAIDPLVVEPIAMPPNAMATDSGIRPIDIEVLQIEPLRPQ